MRFTKPRPRTTTEDALIPLINVVFLMLIFFMIAGQVSAPEALNIEPPISRQGRLTQPERILLLMDAQGRVALDGEIVPASALPDRLAARLATARAAQANPSSASIGISLKADSSVTQGQLRTLLHQLRRLGIERLRVLSQQAERE